MIMGRISICFLAFVVWQLSSLVYAGPLHPKFSTETSHYKSEITPEFGELQMRTKRKPAIALLLAINDEKKKNNRIHALKIDGSDEDDSVDESDRHIGKHLLDSLIHKGQLERIPESKIPKPGDTLLEQKYNELFHVFTKVMEEIYTSGNTISLKDSGSYPTKVHNKEREVEVSVEVDVSTDDHHLSEHDHSVEVEVDVDTKIDHSFEHGETVNISVEEDIEIATGESDEESIIVEVNEREDQPMREQIEVDVDVDVGVENDSGDVTSVEFKNQLKTKKKKQKSRKKKYGMSYIQDQLKMLLGVDCDCKEEDFDLSPEETRIYEIRDKEWFSVDSDEMLTSVIKVPREAPSTKKSTKEKKRTPKLNETKEMKKKKSKKNMKEMKQKENLEQDENDQVKDESGETKIKNLEKKVEKLQKYLENQIKQSKVKDETEEKKKETTKKESKKTKPKKSFEMKSFEIDYDDLDDLDSVLPIPIVPRKPSKKIKTPKKEIHSNKKLNKNKKEEETIVDDNLKYFRDLAEKMEQTENENLSNRHAKRSYRNWRKGTLHQDTNRNDEKSLLFRDQQTKQDNEFYEKEKQSYRKVQSSWPTGDDYPSNSNNEDKTLFTAIAQEMGLDLSQINPNVTAQLFKLYRKYSHLLDTDGGSEYIRRLTDEMQSPMKSGRIKLIPEHDEIRKILSEANIDLDELLTELQQILGIELNAKNQNGNENESKLSDNSYVESKPKILKLF